MRTVFIQQFCREMSVTAVSASLSSVKWEEEDCYLFDFTQKFTLPQVAKITKGQYLNLGVPSLANPSLNQMVLLAQTAKRLKVAAQCVKFKDGSRVVPVGTKLAIPDTYEGWFEILSEDGRAVRCIESVAELLRRFPETCLVRENIKAHLAKTDNAEIISDKTRVINAGETLVLVSEVHVTPVRSKSSGRYLRCFTIKGETIFLSADQKGKFSPIAGEDNISGVHTIKNLLSKRFPLMVRLVHGKPPNGIKNNSHFVTEMRLYSLFEEESIMALPLQKDSHIVALPPSVPLKVQAPKNPETLLKLKNYDILMEKSKSLVQDVSDKIQMFDISMSKELRGEKIQSKKVTKFFSSGNRIQRSISDPSSKCKNNKPETVVNEKLPERQPDVIHDNYDEIDQIYDYIRGFAPLPTKTVTNAQEDMNGNIPVSPNHSSTPSSSEITPASTKSSDTPDDRPEPPPIETIPARRPSKDEMNILPPERVFKSSDLSKDFDKVEGHIYEKVETVKQSIDGSRKSHEKLFISHPVNPGVKKFLMKSPAQQRIQHKTKFFKYSRSSPTLKDIPIQKACQRQKNTRSKSLITSPLFNIRYKSLINLAVDFDTLDSSNSGGKVSFTSGGSKDKMQNRRNRLQRPKSLTDLFANVNQVDNFCSYRNFEVPTNGIENRKLIFLHETENGKLFNGHHSKRIGTLYL